MNTYELLKEYLTHTKYYLSSGVLTLQIFIIQVYKKNAIYYYYIIL